MNTPMTTVVNKKPASITTGSEAQVIEELHYLPGDFDGDYHVEQDDETESLG